MDGGFGISGVIEDPEQRMVAAQAAEGGALGDWEKEENREHSRKRIVIEHVFGRLKVFKIIAEKYRNRRKRFDVRFNLIAAIHNFELP
ncbi:MAG: transposase [Chlorobi bacterium]|nr:transposase [Chlorobiota bacterium]